MVPLTYHVSASLDGFIAAPDGSVGGFSWHDAPVAPFAAGRDRYGTVLMGRKTFQAGLKGDVGVFPFLRQIVFSRTLGERLDVEVVPENPAPFVRALKAEADAPVWLCGGGSLAATLLRAGLVDRVVVKLNPVLIGSGVSLVGAGIDPARLALTSTEAWPCGVVVVRYEVTRPVEAPAGVRRGAVRRVSPALPPDTSQRLEPHDELSDRPRSSRRAGVVPPGALPLST